MYGHVARAHVLHRVVSAHWPDFLARAEAHEPGLPRFVTHEVAKVDDYLRCGLRRFGFAELASGRRGYRMLVGFNCKHRGFCPSCDGRRMADVAAHLVDHVLPAVPVRQWVITLPWRLRVAVAYDRRLCADVLRAFLEALEASLRRRAKVTLGRGRAMAPIAPGRLPIRVHTNVAWLGGGVTFRPEHRPWWR